MARETARARISVPIALCFALLASAATGCSRGGAPGTGAAEGSRVTTSIAGSPATGSSAEVTTEPAVPPGESVAERAMPFEKRKATMPAGMPIEIPVIDGSVTSTSAPAGDGTWLYTLETPGTIASVADWYARAYANAEWQVVADSSADDGLTLTFAKNAARTTLRVRVAAPRRVEVHASIGLGKPAPATN